MRIRSGRPECRATGVAPRLRANSSTSLKRKRRCPPGVVNDRSRPRAAHWRTVTGFTINNSATSLGVRWVFCFDFFMFLFSVRPRPAPLAPDSLSCPRRCQDFHN